MSKKKSGGDQGLRVILLLSDEEINQHEKTSSKMLLILRKNKASGAKSYYIIGNEVVIHWVENKEEEIKEKIEKSIKVVNFVDGTIKNLQQGDDKEIIEDVMKILTEISEENLTQKINELQIDIQDAVALINVMYTIASSTDPSLAAIKILTSDTVINFVVNVILKKINTIKVSDLIGIIDMLHKILKNALSSASSLYELIDFTKKFDLLLSEVIKMIDELKQRAEELNVIVDRTLGPDDKIPCAVCGRLIYSRNNQSGIGPICITK